MILSRSSDNSSKLFLLSVVNDSHSRRSSNNSRIIDNAKNFSRSLQQESQDHSSVSDINNNDRSSQPNQSDTMIENKDFEGKSGSDYYELQNHLEQHLSNELSDSELQNSLLNSNNKHNKFIEH